MNYEFDISKPVGERVTKLEWPDGTAVSMDETLKLGITPTA